MAFQDMPMIAGLVHKAVSGLGLTKTASLTLEVASGSVAHHDTGITYTLSSAKDKVFVADATHAKQVFMGIIDNGSTTDLWVDEYLDDGLNVRGDPPVGYELVLTVGWFELAANETDLANSTIYRRTYA